MPINLSEIKMVNTNSKQPDPKWFHEKLTGNGKKKGLITEAYNPGVLDCDTTLPKDIFGRSRTWKNGNSKQFRIPLRPANVQDKLGTKTQLQKKHGDAVPLGANAYGQELGIHMELFACLITEKDKERTLTPGFDAYVYVTADPNDPYHAFTGNVLNYSGKHERNLCIPIETACPKATLEKLLTPDVQKIFNIQPDAIQGYLESHPIYGLFMDAVGLWQERLPEEAKTILETNAHLGLAYRNEPDALAISFMSNLEQYPVTLDDYKEIYGYLTSMASPKTVKEACRGNLNLRLSEIMTGLKENQGILNHVPKMVNRPQTYKHFSISQSGAILSSNPLVLVQSAAGTGKALPLNTPILTPKGWVNMGNLKVGDEVIGSNGKPCHVIRIHEQGKKEGYDLTFRDGAKIKACKEHLWTVRYTKKGDKYFEKTITTEEWVSKQYNMDHMYLPIVKPVEYEYGEKDLPLDPYFLGALLADGCLCQNSIQYTKSEDAVRNETAKAAKRNGYEIREITTRTSTAKQWMFPHPDEPLDKNGKPIRSFLKETLRNMGLLVKSKEKFIPEEYKTASPKQRRQLLHGLFDGDGDVRTGREYARFNTASPQMAEDVLQLLWSLGLSATKQEQTHKKGNYWSINLLDRSWNPFIASEHKSKIKGAKHQMRRKLSKVKPIDPIPMRCIEVDAEDKLYVTKDFIVTHNSSTILGRMEHMRNMGIPMEKLLVLSFTNAAANHILEKEPTVHSSTIASFVHSIYKENFKHELSNLDTLINSMDIWFDRTTDSMVSKFISCLDGMRDSSGTQSFTRTTNFIEENMEWVLKTLDKIKQTTLELEIIICYLIIDRIKEPEGMELEHIIIDEVQDTSIFEFVFLLRYTLKHKTSLFIVGDGSQTLYEFRASNPKALNIMEASGIFETHALQTNYRSNQEILDFANMSLENIEANRYANLRLHSNDIASAPDKSTFMRKVKLRYRQLSKMSELKDAIPLDLRSPEVASWISACLGRGEKVAILSYARKEVEKAKETLEEMYPGRKVSSLVPRKQFNSTVFSKYIRQRWNNVSYMPPNDILTHIGKDIMNNLGKLTYVNKWNPDETYKAVSYMLESFRKSHGLQIAQEGLLHLQGAITKEKFLNDIRDCMLQFEIQNNSVRQSLLSKQNEDSKNDTSGDFIVSTIHSAKGLEFQNVIVIHRNKNCMSEEMKRMYYVAFTRATSQEYVLSYDTTDLPLVCYDYLNVVESLPGDMTEAMEHALPITDAMMRQALEPEATA